MLSWQHEHILFNLGIVLNLIIPKITYHENKTTNAGVFVSVVNVNAQNLIVDSLFGTNGIHNVPFIYTEEPVKLIVQQDGKIN